MMQRHQNKTQKLQNTVQPGFCADNLHLLKPQGQSLGCRSEKTRCTNTNIKNPKQLDKTYPNWVNSYDWPANVYWLYPNTFCGLWPLLGLSSLLLTL